MSKFSDFVKDENNGKINVNFDKEKQNDDFKKLIDKYSTYSEDDLMKEFLEEGIKKKENGELSEDNLLKIKNVLFPYLDDTQKQKLNDLLNMVKWCLRKLNQIY